MIQLNDVVTNMPESITLKLNTLATKLSNEGKKIYNLTAGQLPYTPSQNFLDAILKEITPLASYQYSPTAGFKELKDKFLNYLEESRRVNLKEKNFDACISNGAKSALNNTLMTIINPGDEVVVIAPYWISYPELIKLYGGVPCFVETKLENNFEPTFDDLKLAINKQTKAIIINSPNNPSGTHYSKEWMQKLAKFLTNYPDLLIISDEIYYELSYMGEIPTYFYQYEKELLKRTLIIEGISKSLACTGLRIGYVAGPKEVVSEITKLQGQSASGANSLVQRALISYDFKKNDEFLTPVKNHLKSNNEILHRMFKEYNLESALYKTSSAFYFMVDFSKTKLFARAMNNLKQNASCSSGCCGSSIPRDISMRICEDLIEKKGVAMVPGGDFGLMNMGRISIVLESNKFQEALKELLDYLMN